MSVGFHLDHKAVTQMRSIWPHSIWILPDVEQWCLSVHQVLFYTHCVELVCCADDNHSTLGSGRLDERCANSVTCWMAFVFCDQHRPAGLGECCTGGWCLVLLL